MGAVAEVTQHNQMYLCMKRTYFNVCVQRALQTTVLLHITKLLPQYIPFCRLSDNHVGENGARHIAEALRNNLTLQHLE